MNTLTLRTCILLVLGALALGWMAAAQPALTAADVLNQMEQNVQSIDDLDATITVQTYKDGAVNLTEQLRLSLLQPDRMRQEYLEPDYLAGNLTLVVGNSMWIYIAAADTWYAKDLSELSTAEQPWLVFRQFLRGVQDELNDYTFELIADESDVYHLEGVPATDNAVYGRIELWVDPQTFVPSRRVLYDVDGNLLVDARISDVERIDDVFYMARSMEAYDEAGVLQSVIHYDSIVVNSGLNPALFEHTAEATQ